LRIVRLEAQRFVKLLDGLVGAFQSGEGDTEIT
jgi:hypothetical protein